MFVFWTYRKNFIGTRKGVRMIHGKRAIGVRAIEVLLYITYYCKEMPITEKLTMVNGYTKLFAGLLLSFRHHSESRFLLGALHRRSKFANFYHDLMQNHLS